MWVYAWGVPNAMENEMTRTNDRQKQRWIRTTLPRETWVERSGITGCIVGVFILSTRPHETEYRVETLDGIQIWRCDEFTILPTPND